MSIKVENLKPVQQIELSKDNGIRVIAERSRDGKRLRYARETLKGFTVFRDVASYGGEGILESPRMWLRRVMQFVMQSM